MGCGVSTSRIKTVQKSSIFDISEGKKASNNVIIKQYIQYSNRVRRSTMTPSKTLNQSTNKGTLMVYDEHRQHYKIPSKQQQKVKSQSAHQVPSISNHSQLAQNGLSEQQKSLVSKLQPGYMRKDVTGVSAVLSVFQDDKGIAVTTANGTSQNKTLKICRWLNRVLAQESQHGNKFFNPQVPQVWPVEIRQVSNVPTNHSAVRDYHDNNDIKQNKVNATDNNNNYYNNINTNYQNRKYANDTCKQDKYNDSSVNVHVAGTQNSNGNTNYKQKKQQQYDYRYNIKVSDTNRNNIVDNNNEIDNNSDTNGSYDSSSSDNSGSNNNNNIIIIDNNNQNSNSDLHDNNKFDRVKEPNYNRGAHYEQKPLVNNEQVDNKNMRRWDQDQRGQRQDAIDKRVLRQYWAQEEQDDFVQIN